LRRLICRSTGVAAVRESTVKPLRTNDFFFIARGLSGDDDE